MNNNNFIHKNFNQLKINDKNMFNIKELANDNIELNIKTVDNSDKSKDVFKILSEQKLNLKDTTNVLDKLSKKFNVKF